MTFRTAFVRRSRRIARPADRETRRAERIYARTRVPAALPLRAFLQVSFRARRRPWEEVATRAVTEHLDRRGRPPTDLFEAPLSADRWVPGIRTTVKTVLAHDQPATVTIEPHPGRWWRRDLLVVNVEPTRRVAPAGRAPVSPRRARPTEPPGVPPPPRGDTSRTPGRGFAPRGRVESNDCVSDQGPNG